jgi:hypothetical protein
MSKVSGEVRYTLSTYDLDNLPEYLALSYCWGSPNRSKTIDCNGTSVKISSSLGSGLGRLEQLPALSGKLIWIDQICVNQDDLAERAHQVQLMERIFGQAGRVVVWLPIDSAMPVLDGNSAGFRLAERIYQSTWESVDSVGLPLVHPDVALEPQSRGLPKLPMSHGAN